MGCLGIWDLRAGQESLECLEKWDDRALLDPEACLDKRAQMDQGDLQESEDHPELKVCLVWRAVREPPVLMGQMVLPVLLVSVANGEKKVHQANREHLGWED